MGGQTFCTRLADHCEKSAVTNVEENLARGGRRLPLKCVNTLYINYFPWLEGSPGLKVDDVKRFQDLIGHICWSVKIGHVDILLDIPLLSVYLAIPCIEHLEQVLNIFGYLKLHPNSKLGFDLDHTDRNENHFHNNDYLEFYRYSSEAIPGNKTVPRLNYMATHSF